MTYHILGVSWHQTEPQIPESETSLLFVAWQSNMEDLPFLWRCTAVKSAQNLLPTPEDIQHAAAIGRDVAEKELVCRLFPYLPADRLTD